MTNDAKATLTPAPMEGHGAYNRSSRVQAAGLSGAVPLLRRAAAEAALPTLPAPIVVADYGASEGRNSMAPICVAIDVLRERAGPHRAISVVHTDLPDNDFSALFNILAGEESYVRGDSEIFPAAIGRSFYQQILPTGSVSLAWSSWAVQWLSRLPAPIPDHVQVAYSQDEDVRAAFGEQAAEDWRAFLNHRDLELRAGGRLVVLTMAIDDVGGFGYGPVLDAMYAALQSLVDEGLVSAQEARRMAIPTVGRSYGDLLAPFGAGNCFGGLHVEQVEVFSGEDRIWAEFERGRDARAFGASWAAFSRASVFPSLAAGLDDGRASPRAAAFMASLEAGMATRLAALPQPMLIPLARMLIAKDAG